MSEEAREGMPASVVRWVGRVTGGSVAAVQRLRGGVASTVHALRVAAPGRPAEELVLRTGQTAEEVAAEAAVLGAIGARSPLAPRLVAADPHGDDAGCPALLMSRLPGRPQVRPGPAPGRWLDGLARAVAEVVRIGDSAGGTPALPALSAFRPWYPPTLDPPPWSSVPLAWTRAAASLLADPPAGARTGLVHRDLHPGNVLFAGGELTGIVDWVNASVGPIEVDLSRCAVEVALLAGVGAADALIERCRPLTGGYDRRWNALVAWELAPWVDDLLELNAVGASVTAEAIRNTLDAVVADAAGTVA